MLREETIHFTLSIIAGVMVGWLTGNYWAVPVALVSGFFIDTDHLVDYVLYKKFRGLNLKEFFGAKYFDASGKVIVPLHGYEYGIILIVIGSFIPNLDWFYWSLGVSTLLHLIYDVLSNHPKWQTYSIIFRIYHNFDHRVFDFKKG